MNMHGEYVHYIEGVCKCTGIISMYKYIGSVYVIIEHVVLLGECNHSNNVYLDDARVHVLWVLHDRGGEFNVRV